MTDFLIIGAGVIGLMLARQLSDQGASVTIIDKGFAGSESSWAGGGIISPLYPWRYSPLVTQLTQNASQQYHRLAETLWHTHNIDIEYAQHGLVVINSHEIATALAWASAHNVAVELLEPTHSLIKQNHITPLVDNGCFLPAIAQIRTPRLMQALKCDIQMRANVTLIEHCAALQLVANSRQITEVVTQQQSFSAANIIICAGAWSKALLQPLQLEIPIVPVRGQMLALHGNDKVLSTIVLHGKYYLIPRRDNTVIVGSTLEYVGFDKNTTDAGYHKLLTQAVNLCAPLKHFTVVKHWAGLRPGSLSSIPYIGKINPFENLYINAGHFRNGLVLAPAATQLLADQLLFKKHSELAQAYQYILDEQITHLTPNLVSSSDNATHEN